MSRFTQIIYQVVFATKGRKPSLARKDRMQLFASLASWCVKHKCHPYKINGVDDHVHILFALSPSICLSDFVKDIKLMSSDLIRNKLNMPDFDFWQKGYAAFTYSNDSLPALISYVANQEIHHQKRNAKEELIALLVRHELEFKENWLYED